MAKMVETDSSQSCMIFGEAGTLHYFGGVRFIAREMSLVKILLIADAWMPYVSGFVRTFSTTVEHLVQLGHEVDVITPYMFRRIHPVRQQSCTWLPPRFLASYIARSA